MKKLFIGIIFLLTSLLSIISAQSYSVSNTSGGNVAGSVVSYNETAISITFNWSGQKADPTNIWKFQLSFGYPTDVRLYKSGQVEENWTDENTPYFDVVGYSLLPHNCSVKMYEFTSSGTNLGQKATTSCTVTPMQTVYVGNNFGGTILVNGSTSSSGSGFDLGPGQSLSLTAIENQTDQSGYTMVWGSTSRWNVNDNPISSSQNYSYSANSSQNGATITAELRRVCTISFGGPVYSGGTYYNSTPVPAIEGTSVQVTALGCTSSDYIDQAFQSWSDNNTVNPRYFTVSSNSSFGINYVGVKPNNGYKNMQYTGSVGQNIHFTWSEHPNSDVTTYQIWRKVKNVSGPTLLAELSRGTTSFTDYEYTYTNGYTDNLLDYDVRAYYSPASGYADVDYSTTFGRLEASTVENNLASSLSNELPVSYSISNYPNPFNPTTTIHYQLPENGFVTIKVYDLLGKEVATLVNENKNAGYYNVNFNAGKLTSGIYIYTINSGKYSQSMKMLLMK